MKLVVVPYYFETIVRSQISGFPAKSPTRDEHRAVKNTKKNISFIFIAKSDILGNVENRVAVVMPDYFLIEIFFRHV